MRRNDEHRAENYIARKKRYRKWIAAISILSVCVAIGTLYLLNKPATAVSEDGASSVGMVLSNGSPEASTEASANDGQGQDAIQVASVTEGTSEDGSSVSSTSASSASTASSASDAGAARSVSGVVLTGVFTDQNGKKIHEDTKLSVSDVLDLTAAPEKIEGYQYQKATINDKTVKSIRKITSSDVSAAGSEAGEGESGSAASATYMYVMEDDSEVKVTEDTEIDFLYEAVSDAKAVSVKATLVDEFGNEIDADKYSDISLPAFDRDGVLHLDDAENPPYEDVRVKTGLFKSVKYSFEKATVGESVITALKRTSVSGTQDAGTESISADFVSSDASSAASMSSADSDTQKYAYFYTTDGKEWTALSEDTVVKMIYTSGKKTSYTYEDNSIKVTATLQKADAIPDDAELVVTPVTEESKDYNYDAYMQALNDNADKIADSASQSSATTEYSNTNTLLYDIAFIETDEKTGKKTEAEPAEGSVAITFEMKDHQLEKKLCISNESQLAIIHMPLTENVQKAADTTAEATDIQAKDVTVETVEDATVSINKTEAVEYSLSSLSLTALTVKNDNPGYDKDWLYFRQGQYYTFTNTYTDADLAKIGKTKADISLEYHCISDDSETYEGSGFKNLQTGTDYYNESLALGIAGNFHIVAFDTARLNTHTNGNILANTLYAGANFGTNNYDEVSYIANNYALVNGSSESQDKNMLVVPKGTSISLVDNGSKFAIKGTKLDRPNILYEDGSKSFVSLDKVKEEITSLSSQLSSYNSSSNISKSVESSQFVNYTLTDPDGVGVINLDADKINNANINFKGFESGHSGSIIVNVNCSGRTNIEMPQEAQVYIDNVRQSTSETTTFTAGKVVWNFYNCKGCTISARQMTGAILAVGATLNADSNVNGTIIADNVNVNAETHRSDFTGKTTGDNTAFGVTKTFTGNIWPDSGAYDIVFDRASTDEHGPLPSTTELQLTKDSYTGYFGNISFPYTDSYKNTTQTYYYSIHEDSTKNTVANVTYDNSYYYIRVRVNYSFDNSTGNRAATITDIGYSKQSSKSVAFSSLKYSSFDKNDSLSTFVFNNSYQATKDITVNKMWTGDTDNKGVAVTRWNVTLKLFDNAGKEVQKNADGNTVAPYTMTGSDQSAANTWSHAFKNLKKYDSSGKEITYSVKEYHTDSNGKLTELVKGSSTSVGGYYLSSYTTSSDGDVIILTNKYNYSITVTKEWLEADGTAITNLKDTKDFSPVYIRLYGYVPNNKSSDSIDQIETLSYENGWKATITDLPQTDGKYQYIYYIQEVDSSGKALTESNLIQYYQIINGTASTKTTDPTKNIFYATGGAKGTLILSCVNTRSSYRLPETGSVGTTPFRMIGILLIGIAAGSALYMKRKRPLR